MTIMPTYSLEHFPLEEVLGDFERFDLAYHACQKEWVYEPCDVKEEEKRLTDHLVRNLLPITKTHPYFSRVHCEPREVIYGGPAEGLLGHRSCYMILLHKLPGEDPIMFSVITHETVHALKAVSDDDIVTLMGWEVDALMALAGYECHRISLYRCLRDMAFHVSYLKARAVGRVTEWICFIHEFYGDKITRDIIDENIEHFDDGEKGKAFGHRLSDYSVPPYLAIKSAIRSSISCVVDENHLLGPIERNIIDISALVQIWNGQTAQRLLAAA